jgi:hypothetical protein
MAILITTPGFTTGNPNEYGTNNLSKIFVTGTKSRKLITFKNDDLVSAVTFTLSLTQSGSSYEMVPSAAGVQTFNLFPNTKVTVAIDHISAGGTGEDLAYLSSDTDVFGVYDAVGASYDSTNPVLGPAVDSITFAYVNYEYPVKRELGPFLTVDEEGRYQIDQAGKKLTQDETSFGIIRTNPKLTGNIKITVDSASDIWLNSIEAEKELADDRFKKYRISPNSSYAIDVNRFFDTGSTPPEIVYSLYQADSQYTSTKRSLDQQYDRFYQYGVTALKSRFYSEDFSFFAPIYLKEEVPDYFIILRTDGAINKFSYDLPFNEWPTEVTSQILDNSTIVKTYSLGPQTPIGKYLRNIITHPSRKPSDISVSYQQNGYTTYNGICYPQGSFAQMGELLYDYINQENPLISVEDYITLGFERNSVISTHVLNLEFLFNDDEAENYTINRYFGLYVNAIDLARFNMSGAALQEYSLSVGQTPLPRKGVDGNKISLKSFTQTNDTGIRVYAEADTVVRLDGKTPEKLFSSIVISGATSSGEFSITCPGNFESKLSVDEYVNFSYPSGITASAMLQSFSYENDYTTLTFDESSYDSTLQYSLFVNTIQTTTINFYSAEKYEIYKDSIFNNSLIEGAPRFFYLQDRDGDFHRVDSTRTVYANTSVFTSSKAFEFKLKDRTLDMSKLGGFSSLLTQTEAKALQTVGKSSMKVTFNTFLTPNDYLEVRWEPGPTSSGYPLRWKVKANDTGLTAGEWWPGYTLTSDSEGEYYLAYFHPGNQGVLLTDFVKSVEEAFNQFPFKNFEVLAKGADLFIRSTQEGVESDSAQLHFYTDFVNSIKLMDINMSSTSGTQNFIGGSRRKRTRARISSSVAKGLLDYEYLSTKGSYSLIKKNDIQGNSILFAPYLEEPVYDETGEKLVDFIDSDKYSVIVCDDELHEVQLTFDNKITTYELFKPSYGIFSMLPVRDFDTDFYSSEYSKSYLPELLEYFSRGGYSPVTVTASDLSGPVIYTFDNPVTFPSGTTFPYQTPFLQLSAGGESAPVLQNERMQLLFGADGATTAELLFSPNDGELPSDVPAIGHTLLILPENQQLVFSDEDLSTFKGFLALSGIISAEDEAEFQALENLWNPQRFVIQLLNSEYERMGENYLKTLVLKSRVVPYVLKWVAPQGKDIRENPYRFNYHRAFGNMNYSPSLFLQQSDPRFHTHEWPYLDSMPLNYPITTYPEGAFSYFFEPINDKYNFLSLEKDWFSEYFSVGYPTEKVLSDSGYSSLKIDPSERYSYFNFENFTDKTFTLFRGQRIQIDEIDTVTGEIVPGSTKYNNYRYSTIIRMDEDDAIDNQDPIEFKTIVNEKWKFIILVITVRTSTWKSPNGNMRYVDLYTLNDDSDYSEYKTSSSTYEVGSYTTALPADVKLSSPIDLSTLSGNPDLTVTFGYYDLEPSNSNYIDSLFEQIQLLSTGSYSDIIAIRKNGNFSSTVNIPPPLSIFSPSTLQLSGSYLYFMFSGVDSNIETSLPYSSFNWSDFTFYHQLGGENCFIGMRERLTFFEISNVIQGISSRAVMQYEICNDVGTISNTPNFSMQMIAPENLQRVFDYFPVSDPNKPPQYYSYDNIGIVLQEQKDLQSLYRYQGDFSPKFTDAIKFWLREDDELSIAASKDFLFNNTHIGTELNEFSLMKNQFYMKVSESEILTITPDSGFLPVYPLVNEIAIDRKDLFAWSSSWDNNYYRYYSDLSNYTSLKGTDEMKEVKSAFGTKTMKLPKQFDLYEFKLFVPPTAYPSAENILPYVDQEISFLENDVLSIIQVNVYERLIREMIGDPTILDRARREFLSSIEKVPGSFDESILDDTVRDYLVKNVMDLYEISQVKLYVLQTGDPGEGLIATVQQGEVRPFIETTTSDSDVVTLSEAELLNRGYFQKKDTVVNNISNLIFNATYNIDTRYYTSISVGVVVKRI